jgi:hypothetical protein
VDSGSVANPPLTNSSELVPACSASSDDGVARFRGKGEEVDHADQTPPSMLLSSDKAPQVFSWRAVTFRFSQPNCDVGRDLLLVC